MALLPKELGVLAYANGFTLWHYSTPDAHTTVRVTGYFNGASDVLRLGDMILANTGTGSAAAAAGILLVNANSGGTVDVSDLTQVGAVDSD